MPTILGEARSTEVALDDGAAPGALWLTPDVLADCTGWQLVPEGLCRDDVCVPLSDSVRERLVAGDRVDASGLWGALDRPVLHDEAETTWVLGESAGDRSARLETLVAPDFTLPDLDGVAHSLSDFRGRKVFLATWASW